MDNLSKAAELDTMAATLEAEAAANLRRQAE